MIRMAVAGVALAGLAACSTGISSGGNQPSANVTVPTDVQAVYNVVTAQAERCLRGEGGAYTVHGTMDEAKRHASVRVVAPLTEADVAQVTITAQGDRQSQVDIVMWGRGIWNDGAVRAMREAVIYQVPSCSTYMPTTPVAGQQPKK
jgi:hypothetical protein